MEFSSLITRLKRIVGPDGVFDRREDVMMYEYDAGATRGTPRAVVFPRTTEHVSAIMRLAGEARVPIVPRGAGTGLSGGAISQEGGVILGFSRMNRILEIDLDNHRAVVQPGVVNLDLSNAVSRHRFCFAPDPSSSRACTVGGNVAENSGGPHTLAHGVTVNHVTGLEVVLPDGRVITLGGKAADSCGYDLTGFFVGSEGTIGIATRITVKLTRLPEAIATLLAIFNTIDDAANTIVALTAEGITPAAMEMLDGWTLRVVEEATHAGYPLDSGAVLLIEVEGLREAVQDQQAAIRQVCLRQNAREVRTATAERQRQLLWAGRKNAFGALGRLSRSYYSQDGVVPRTRIPDTLRRIAEIGEKYGTHIGNVLHAGDGNLHPVILFDDRSPEQTQRAHEISREIMEYCVSIGGSLTGEHGVGLEKRHLMSLMFTDDDITVMARLRNVFNPGSILNPQKVLPTTRSCRETAGHWLPALAAAASDEAAP